eukprot:scaffold990_cov393-Prasinococcus_capsulatus_cf.AAC.21
MPDSCREPRHPVRGTTRSSGAVHPTATSDRRLSSTEYLPNLLASTTSLSPRRHAWTRTTGPALAGTDALEVLGLAFPRRGPARGSSTFSTGHVRRLPPTRKGGTSGRNSRRDQSASSGAPSPPSSTGDCCHRRPPRFKSLNRRTTRCRDHVHRMKALRRTNRMLIIM